MVKARDPRAGTGVSIADFEKIRRAIRRAIFVGLNFGMPFQGECNLWAFLTYGHFSPGGVTPGYDGVAPLAQQGRINLRPKQIKNLCSGHQRSAAIVSEGTLAPIWCPRVQTIYGIVRRRLADCPSAFRIRPAQHRVNNTSSAC